VSVRDTGVGISAKDATRIFAPFEQATHGQKQESGVGLGLAITRELARLMGGDVEVDSQPGRGSQFRFRVTLPVVPARQAIPAQADSVVGYLGSSRSILVVDDQEENRRLLQQLLEPLGFGVILAAGGREAVASAQANRPDLIVMDLRMPGMDGVEAARAIRAAPGLEKIFIVAASASSADLDRAGADPETFVACLRKPFQTADFLDAIRRPLGLTWRYAGAANEPGAGAGPVSADSISPPRAALEELLDLARMGKLVRVEQIALELEQRDARYTPFSRRLYALARGFEEEHLVAMLEDCIGTSGDVPA
jgi:CheY-like chemotaxis protein